MRSEPSKIKNILVISLSNIGDVILTFPVMDALMYTYAHARISVVVGPKAVSLFEGNPHVAEVIVFDKHQDWWQMVKWIWALRKKGYDCVVDLRHTAIPLLLGVSCRTSLKRRRQDGRHKKQQHLDRLKDVCPISTDHFPRQALCISEKDRSEAQQMLTANQVKEPFVVVAAGAADESKRWHAKGFAEVCNIFMSRYGYDVIFVGDCADVEFSRQIVTGIGGPTGNLTGQTSLKQLAAVISRCAFVLANDSGVMHLASYLDVPTAALFGPTDPALYGPWSTENCAIKIDLPCGACQPTAAPSPHTCMTAIQPGDVMESLKINFPELFPEYG